MSQKELRNLAKGRGKIIVMANKEQVLIRVSDLEGVHKEHSGFDILNATSNRGLLKSLIRDKVEITVKVKELFRLKELQCSPDQSRKLTSHI